MLSTLVLEAQLEVATDIGANIRLFADRRAVKQMLVNLLSNAIKFSHKFGQIQISATIDEVGQVIVSVADSGIGIARERLRSIVEPFASDNVYAKDKGGAGIGLSITKRLINLHDGELLVVSEPGKGSTFSLAFPPPDPALPRAKTG